jgi:hypothetical protein
MGLDDTGGLPVPGGDRQARNVLRGVEAGIPGSATRASALDHVVVVLFENRSLDNVLGRLYGPGDGKAFEGVIGKELSNPIPDGRSTALAARWCPTASVPTWIPLIRTRVRSGITPTRSCSARSMTTTGSRSAWA